VRFVERHAADLQDPGDLGRNDPGHGEMLEDRRGVDQVEFLAREVRRQLVGIAHDVHVPSRIEVESNEVGVRESLPRIRLAGDFPASDFENPHSGFVEEIHEMTQPPRVGDGLGERHIRVQEFRVDVGLVHWRRVVDEQCEYFMKFLVA
jgi:hypothetical protein